MSKFLGQIGERLEFDVRLYEEPTRIETDWGSSFLYKFEDENGNQLIWFTNKEQPIDSGKRYHIRGTIKKHVNYGKVKETHLSRVIILSVGEFDNDIGKDFDELCREHGILLQEDYNTKVEYRKTRRKAELPI